MSDTEIEKEPFSPSNVQSPPQANILDISPETQTPANATTPPEENRRGRVKWKDHLPYSNDALPTVDTGMSLDREMYQEYMEDGLRQHPYSPRDTSPVLHTGRGGWQLGLAVGEKEIEADFGPQHFDPLMQSAPTSPVAFPHIPRPFSPNHSIQTSPRPTNAKLFTARRDVPRPAIIEVQPKKPSRKDSFSQKQRMRSLHGFQMDHSPYYSSDNVLEQGFLSQDAPDEIKDANPNFTHTTPHIRQDAYEEPVSAAAAFLNLFASTPSQSRPPNWVGEQIGSYVIGRMLGFGAFSEVHECFAVDQQDGHTTKYAVKIVASESESIDMLNKEIFLWKQLDHPNICRYMDAIRNQDGLFIFSERCDGHLLDYMRSCEFVPEEKAKDLFRQIAEAVRYLHEDMRIVHRDIKPENVLLINDSKNIKLADFGLSDYYEVSELDKRKGEVPPKPFTDPAYAILCTGSLAYCSPEELHHLPSALLPSADVWSLGVILYALLSGDLPFGDEYLPRLQQSIHDGAYRPLSEGTSEEAQDLVKRLLTVSVKERLNIAQVLAHTWLLVDSG